MEPATSTSVPLSRRSIIHDVGAAKSLVQHFGPGRAAVIVDSHRPAATAHQPDTPDRRPHSPANTRAAPRAETPSSISTLLASSTAPGTKRPYRQNPPRSDWSADGRGCKAYPTAGCALEHHPDLVGHRKRLVLVVVTSTAVMPSLFRISAPPPTGARADPRRGWKTARRAAPAPAAAPAPGPTPRAAAGHRRAHGETCAPAPPGPPSIATHQPAQPDRRMECPQAKADVLLHRQAETARNPGTPCPPGASPAAPGVRRG